MFEYPWKIASPEMRKNDYLLGAIRTRQTDWGDEDILRNKTGFTPEERIADQDRDGVDVEVVFPNKGMHSFGTRDPGFAMAMCRAWNDWAHEDYGPYDRILPMAMIPTIDVDAAIGELERVAALGFRGITIPCKPEYGPTGMDHRNYNQPEFEPLWSAIEDVELPVTIHVSTGRDPRASSGPGGAVINYAVHCCAARPWTIAESCFRFTASVCCLRQRTRCGCPSDRAAGGSWASPVNSPTSRSSAHASGPGQWSINTAIGCTRVRRVQAAHPATSRCRHASRCAYPAPVADPATRCAAAPGSVPSRWSRKWPVPFSGPCRAAAE